MSTPSLVGTTVDQYRVERLLGKGGMGEVYLATDQRLGRPVALKVISSEVAATASAKKRFIPEAVAASKLRHPNVSVIYEADETADGLAYIAME